MPVFPGRQSANSHSAAITTHSITPTHFKYFPTCDKTLRYNRHSPYSVKFFRKIFDKVRQKLPTVNPCKTKSVRIFRPVKLRVLCRNMQRFTHDNLRNNWAIMAELPSSQSNQPATAHRPKAVRLNDSVEPRYGIIKTAAFILSSSIRQVCFTYYQKIILSDTT